LKKLVFLSILANAFEHSKGKHFLIFVPIIVISSIFINSKRERGEREMKKVLEFLEFLQNV